MLQEPRQVLETQVPWNGSMTWSGITTLGKAWEAEGVWGKLVVSNHPGQLYEKEQAAQILNSWFKARSGNKGVSMMRLKESFISCSHRIEVAKNET